MGEPAYADEEVDAIVASHDVARLLAMKGTQFLLRTLQLVYSGKGEPVIYGIRVNRVDRHSLRILRMR